MIVFMDTSALLKLYVPEEESDDIDAMVNSNAEIVVSSVAYVEIHSAMGRRRREGSLKINEMDKLLGDFETHWFEFGKVPLDDVILKRAGTLCLKHPIRALDAIQLASALHVRNQLEEPIVFFTAA